MNFEKLNNSENNETSETEKKPNWEEIYKKNPGVGTHDVEIDMDKGEITLTGRGIAGGLKAGEQEKHEIPTELLQKKEQGPLDKLNQEEREDVLKEANEFAEGKRSEFVGYSIPEQDAKILKIKLEKANELAYNKLKK